MNKQAKYSEIRNFSLIIAGLPGAVLVPFFIAGLVSYLSPFTIEITNAIATPFMFITMAGLPTSAIAMFALLIAALITASKKPTDPESPTPKAKRNQIVLAVIAAAIATAEFIYIFINSFQVDMPCTQVDADNWVCPETDNFLFPLPVSYFALAGYLLTWLAIATIWIRNKKSK
jgi:hypothetical protein